MGNSIGAEELPRFRRALQPVLISIMDGDFLPIFWDASAAVIAVAMIVVIGGFLFARRSVKLAEPATYNFFVSLRSH